MSDRVLRVLLGSLCFSALAVGVWATFLARSFYDDFPGFAREWVSVDGPFNEHLVGDVGGLNLALAVVTGAAAIWLTRELMITACLAWLAYSIPHLVYHFHHLEVYDAAGDQIATMVSLSLGVVVPGLVLLGVRYGRRAEPGPERAPGAV
jgi:hypothetical protein